MRVNGYVFSALDYVYGVLIIELYNLKQVKL